MLTENKENRLVVRVKPSSSGDEITSFDDGVLRVCISAPPRQGKANAALITFLARALGLRKKEVVIISGQTSRNKIVSIYGLSAEEIKSKLWSG